MKQKQKQSVVIKNVINIGERKRMRPRQRRARTQPKDGRQATGGGGMMGGAFNPIGVQFPYQKLFQPQPNNLRSLTMSSANSNEASNNVSALIDKSQQISEGRIRSYINNALSFNAFKRLEESEVIKQSGVRIDVMEDEVMPKIKPEPAFKEKKIDTRPIDLTLDEPLYEDMGIPQLEKVIVEDVSTQEKKDELLAPVDKMQEKITPASGKKPPRAKGTLEQQKKANEKYLKDKATREAKKKKALLLDEYGINE